MLGGVVMGRMGFAMGVGVGLAVALAGRALPQAQGEFGGGGDHYAMAWTVLSGGEVVCQGPFVRPSEREIECRHARSR